jgi:hypothetical protein
MNAIYDGISAGRIPDVNKERCRLPVIEKYCLKQ